MNLTKPECEVNLLVFGINSSHCLIYQFKLTQSRIIGAVRGAHAQLWGTMTPVCFSYALRKYNKRFGTLAIV